MIRLQRWSRSAIRRGAFSGAGRQHLPEPDPEVDPLERYVLIDELFPTHGAFFVSPGDEVEITSIRRGIPVRFSTWVKSISITEQDGIRLIRLALPDAVEAKQRRRNFRVPVDADAGVRLRIRGPEGNKLLCTVLNMSLAGALLPVARATSASTCATPVLRNLHAEHTGRRRHRLRPRGAQLRIPPPALSLYRGRRAPRRTQQRRLEAARAVPGDGAAPAAPRNHALLINRDRATP